MPHSDDRFSQPQALGGQLTATSALSAVSWGPDRIDVFGIDGNSMLVHWWYDNGWYQPETLGGPLAVNHTSGIQILSSSLSAVARGDQILDIYAVGNDGTLWHWGYDHGWKNNAQPESLGGSLVGEFVSAISAVSWGPTRLDIFGIDPDGTLTHWQYDTQYGPFLPERQNLGGQLLSPGLSAVSWTPGRLDVFATGTDNGLKHWWYDNTSGNSAGNFTTGVPESLGSAGQVAAPLSAVSWAPGRLDIFGVGTFTTLKHWWYDTGEWGQNGEPEDLGGGNQLTGALQAQAWLNPGAPSGELQIIAGSNDPSLQHWWYENATWFPRYGHSEKTFGEFIGPPVTMVSRGYHRLDVFSCAIDGQLFWWFWE